jgi:outer membrane receptor protein involved in Fe transport
MIDLAPLVISMLLRVLEPTQGPRIVETVSVTGTAASIATPAAVTALGREDLSGSPSGTLDDALRAIPGFSLFRRSSSRVANPTTQGVTLRGLAASGSSRALVLADGVPLNDPVGGWVYWNRVPMMAIEHVAVARGAAGDLRGADAIAGVIAVRTSEGTGFRALAEAGSHETARGSFFGGWFDRGINVVAAAEAFTTDGFVLTGDESRGAIDVEAYAQHGSAHAGVGRVSGDSRVVLRGGHFGESRGNGTPLQRNNTRITHVSAMLDRGSRLSLRGHGQIQRYEQTFSAVAGDRATERLTSEQEVTGASVGAAADWTWSGARGALAVSGAGRLVDAELEQVALTFDGARLAPEVTAPQQALAALAAQGSLHGRRASAGGGLRAEMWQSRLDATNRRVFVSPRLWAVLAATDRLSLRLSVQSGHRAPTINELYRPFRVGNIVTEANAALRPEAARGVEIGASWHRPGVTLRAIGFWSRVDDAITNVTLASGALIVRQRQNAARIRAAGAEFEVEARLRPSLMLTAASSYVDSSFTRGPLEGLRVPQVPRLTHAVGLRGSWRSIRLTGEWRYIGDQYDDDRNAFALDASGIVNARAGWAMRRGIEWFAAVENLTDVDQDVGRTPIRTVGLPRTSRAGVRISF